METICKKCGGRGVVFVSDLEKPSKVQQRHTIRYMIVIAVRSEVTELRYRCAKAITKAFGIKVKWPFIKSRKNGESYTGLISRILKNTRKLNSRKKL